nr:protein PXR1 [Tanacetum cinerariifolium]
NAKNSERRIQHVSSFGDSEGPSEEDEEIKVKPIKHKKKKNKKNKKQKSSTIQTVTDFRRQRSPEKVTGMDGLTEDERKALRGSKFAPLPSSAPTLPRSRLAHPGGPMKTNKAAALAKFLERKSQEPSGLSSINPKLVELAVKNAKETVRARYCIV